MDKRPIILTFVRYYLPGYKSGGPVRTIANMVEHLGDDLDFRIVTSDCDALETVSYSDVMIDDWNVVGKSHVFYASQNKLALGEISQLICDTPHDILYLNSFFDPKFTGLPILGRWLKRLPDKPLVLAPRGEFSTGAMDIRAWKKRPYVWMARLLGLYRRLTWQASSQHELGDIRRVMGNASGTIVVAPDLAAPVFVDGSEALLEERQQGAALRVVFLSRIARKKNLDFALNVLGKTRAPVEFDIYGMVDDDRHWAQCQEQIARLPANITVSCHGAIPHSAVASTLGKYDLFFFPTRGENFGHVILEALSAGLPALISDQTPWRDLDQESVGFVRPLEDESGFVEVIETLASLDTKDLSSLRQRARAYAQRHADDSKTRTSNRELFQNLMPGARR